MTRDAALILELTGMYGGSAKNLWNLEPWSLATSVRKSWGRAICRAHDETRQRSRQVCRDASAAALKMISTNSMGRRIKGDATGLLPLLVARAGGIVEAPGRCAGTAQWQEPDSKEDWKRLIQTRSYVTLSLHCDFVLQVLDMSAANPKTPIDLYREPPLVKVR